MPRFHTFKRRPCPGCAILSLMLKLNSLSNVLLTMFELLLGALRFIRLSLRRWPALPAENLFLRKQLALYLERKVKAATKFALVLLSRQFAWRDALTIVKPDTLIRWHRKGFGLFWRWKSKPRGRPRVSAEPQKLFVEMADENPTWGEERIAAELLKLGVRVSPRTVRRYLPDDTGSRSGRSSQRWMTFAHNHAQGILACDFFVVVTAVQLKESSQRDQGRVDYWRRTAGYLRVRKRHPMGQCANQRGEGLVPVGCPIANTSLRPRMMITPSEMAGVAMRASPMEFVARSSYLGPALTTKTSPSSLAR